MGALDTQVGQIIGNLDQVLTAIASRSGDLGSLVDNLQTVASSLASKNTLLDDVVGNLSGVAADLAKLIGSNHATITSTIDNLQVVAADVQNNQKALSQQPLHPGRRAGALHPDFAVGPVVRRADHVHLHGQPVQLARTTSRPTHRRGRAPEVASRRSLEPRDRPRSSTRRPDGAGRRRRASVADDLGQWPAQGRSRRVMKAFTERRPKVIGLTAIVCIVVAVLAILRSTASVFTSGYQVTARFGNAAGITKGTDVHGGRREGRLGHHRSPCTATRSTPSSR